MTESRSDSVVQDIENDEPWLTGTRGRTGGTDLGLEQQKEEKLIFRIQLREFRSSVTPRCRTPPTTAPISCVSAA